MNLSFITSRPDRIFSMFFNVTSNLHIIKTILVGLCLMVVLGWAYHCLASVSVAFVYYSRVYHCQLFWSSIMYSTSKIVHLKYVIFFLAMLWPFDSIYSNVDVMQRHCRNLQKHPTSTTVKLYIKCIPIIFCSKNRVVCF